MNYDLEILKTQARISALIARSQALTAEFIAMKTENDMRYLTGHSPAYNEKAFMTISDEFMKISDALKKEGGAE